MNVTNPNYTVNVEYWETRVWLGLWAMFLILALGRQGQADLCEFKTNLVYRASSRPARATQRDSDSKQNKQPPCTHTRTKTDRQTETHTHTQIPHQKKKKTSKWTENEQTNKSVSWEWKWSDLTQKERDVLVNTFKLLRNMCSSLTGGCFDLACHFNFFLIMI